jgi:hypothetical protein
MEPSHGNSSSWAAWTGPKEIDGIRLTMTCNACPEQYEAFKEGKQVGYLRLRHGHFTVQCPLEGNELVYEAHPEGDGMFEPEEREKYLEEAAKAISAWLAKPR